MLNQRVPWGKIECYNGSFTGAYLRWAPGDCTAYEIIMNHIGPIACGYTGGDHMISFRIGDRWRSVPLSVDDMGMIHSSVLEEHLFHVDEEISETTLYTVLIYTIMLNYSLFDNDISNEYIDELKQHPWIKSRFGF